MNRANITDFSNLLCFLFMTVFFLQLTDVNYLASALVFLDLYIFSTPFTSAHRVLLEGVGRERTQKWT